MSRLVDTSTSPAVRVLAAGILQNEPNSPVGRTSRSARGLLVPPSSVPPRLPPTLRGCAVEPASALTQICKTNPIRLWGGPPGPRGTSWSRLLLSHPPRLPPTLR